MLEIQPAKTRTSDFECVPILLGMSGEDRRAICGYVSRTLDTRVHFLGPGAFASLPLELVHRESNRLLQLQVVGAEEQWLCAFGLA